MMVIDANVAAKWYLREPGSMEAKAFLRLQEKLIAPEIIKLEVLGETINTALVVRHSFERIGATCHGNIGKHSIRSTVVEGLKERTDIEKHVLDVPSVAHRSPFNSRKESLDVERTIIVAQLYSQ